MWQIEGLTVCLLAELAFFNLLQKNLRVLQGELVCIIARGLRDQSNGSFMKLKLSSEQTSQIIRLAWEDRTSFEDIEKRTGLLEKQVIEIMRAELKPSSYRMWRKRVSGRVTKHRKLMETRFKGPEADAF